MCYRPFSRRQFLLLPLLLLQLPNWRKATHSRWLLQPAQAAFIQRSRMSKFSYDPVWTQNHGFSIGTEVNFAGGNDSAESLTDIPFSVKGLWVFGGNVNFNANGASGRTTMLLRISIWGDPAGGDAGGGPGSVLLVNCALYCHDTDYATYSIPAFAVLLENGSLPVPPDGSAYKMHMKADVAGAVPNTHLEIALAGMWR